MVRDSNGSVLWRRWLDHAEALWQNARHHDALQYADRAALENEEARYAAALLRGRVLLDLGQAKAALSSFESVALLGVPDPCIDAARGHALFELGRFPEATHALRSAIRGDPSLADAHYTLGLLYELIGEDGDTEHFRVARKIDPQRFLPPKQRSRADFEQCIRDAVAELPGAVQRCAEQMPVVVQEVPNFDRLWNASPAISPRCDGLLVKADDIGCSPRIVLTLFKRNLERASSSDEKLIHRIQSTICRLIEENTKALRPNDFERCNGSKF